MREMYHNSIKYHLTQAGKARDQFYSSLEVYHLACVTREALRRLLPTHMQDGWFGIIYGRVMGTGAVKKLGADTEQYLRDNIYILLHWLDAPGKISVHPDTIFYHYSKIFKILQVTMTVGEKAVCFQHPHVTEPTAVHPHLVEWYYGEKTPELFAVDKDYYIEHLRRVMAGEVR